MEKLQSIILKNRGTQDLNIQITQSSTSDFVEIYNKLKEINYENMVYTYDNYSESMIYIDSSDDTEIYCNFINELVVKIALEKLEDIDLQYTNQVINLKDFYNLYLLGLNERKDRVYNEVMDLDNVRLTLTKLKDSFGKDYMHIMVSYKR